MMCVELELANITAQAVVDGDHSKVRTGAIGLAGSNDPRFSQLGHSYLETTRDAEDVGE